MKLIETTGQYRYKLIFSAYKNWVKSGDNILDVGCGTGIITKLLMEDFSVTITGCDVRNYLIYNIPFMKIKAGKLPVKDHSFDTILLNDVLHHIDKNKQTEILTETVRVARKLLIVEAEPTFMGKVADIILNKYHYGNLKTPLSFRTKAEWQRIFKSLSLKSKAIKIKKPFWYPFSHIAFLVTKNEIL